MTAILVILVLLALFALVFRVIARVPRRAARPADEDTLCNSFRLSPSHYRVLGADVGGYPVQFNVRADGLIGRPDVVFMSYSADEVVCGEVKSRHYHGRMTDYERFQAVLYMGALMKHFPGRRVRCLIRYRDRVVEAHYCPNTYRTLLQLRAEYARASRRRPQARAASSAAA